MRKRTNYTLSMRTGTNLHSVTLLASATHGLISFPKLPPPPTDSTQPSSAANNATNNRLKQTQAQVDEVVGIMRVNVEKVLERDQKLSELDQRADALQHGASQFEQQASKLKRKQWWANMKMMIIMGVIGVVLLIIIIRKYSWICLATFFDPG